MNNSDINLNSVKQTLPNEDWAILLSKFPSVEQLRLQLSDYFLLDKSNLSTKEIENSFLSLSLVMPFNSVQYPYELFNSLSLWRARKNIDNATEDLNNCATFSYPDPKYIKANGRANLKGKSVFYCALTGGTAIIETKPEEGDLIYLGKWSVKTDTDIAIMHFLPVNTPEKNMFYKMARSIFESQSVFNSENGRNYSDQLNEVVAFVADAFITERFPYCLTSMLSGKALGQDNEIDAIVYASVARTLSSSNFVFRPTFVDQNFTLNKVFKICVNYRDSTSLIYNLLEVGDKIGEGLIWRQPNKDDESELPENRTSL